MRQTAVCSAWIVSVFILGFSQLCSAAEDFKNIKCMNCHKETIGLFQRSKHEIAFSEMGKTGVNQCIQCHGDPTQHLSVDEPVATTMIGFTPASKKDPEALADQCLTCHKKFNRVAFFKQNKHAMEGVTCANCHTIHQPASATSKTPYIEACFKCHKDIRSDFNKYSHHPVIEGKVTCADCHTIHGGINQKSLVEDSVNQVCYRWDSDKRGPFIWEHPPVSENCLICHNQHGSRNAKLLVEKLPNLCQSCHNDDSHSTQIWGSDSSFGGPDVRDPRNFGRACVNCHTKIHGSHAPAGKSARGKVFFR